MLVRSCCKTSGRWATNRQGVTLENRCAGTSRIVSRHIKLLRYQSPSGGANRTFGAVWQLGNEIRWVSPIARRLNDVLDPQLFVDRFPEAAFDFDHFAAAVTWLESVCNAAHESLDVAQACRREPGLGLSCIRYEGPDQGEDLASLLEGDDQVQLLDVEMLRTVVSLTLKHLVKEHTVLKGLPLELISEGGSSESARLLLPDDQINHVYFDRDTRPSRVGPPIACGKRSAIPPALRLGGLVLCIRSTEERTTSPADHQGARDGYAAAAYRQRVGSAGAGYAAVVMRVTPRLQGPTHSTGRTRISASYEVSGQELYDSPVHPLPGFSSPLYTAKFCPGQP